MKLANSHKLTSQFNPTLQHGLQLFLENILKIYEKKFGTFMTISFEKIYGKSLKNIWKIKKKYLENFEKFKKNI